jgi:outer membrane protein assembly factor BamA
LPGFRLFISACLLSAALISAQSTDSLSVRYVDEVPDGAIADIIERLVSKRDYDSIGVILSDAGYLENELRHTSDSLLIIPGERYRFGEIGLTVVSAGGEINQRIITRYRSDSADRDNFNKIREEILEPYQREGYFFASLNTEHVVMEQGTIVPQLKLITGPQVTMQRVRFRGLRKSNPEFVEKLSGLKMGDPFTREQYRSAARKIEAGGFLRNDSLPIITPNENYDAVELLFYLSEIKSSSLELGGGYQPGPGTEKGDFVGRIYFQTINLFGGGRRIDFTFDRKDRSSSHLEFRFGQPFFIPDHLEAQVHFAQVDYDSSYYLFTADAGLGLITAGNTRIDAGVSWTKTEPQRSSQPPSRKYSGILHFGYRRLDYIPNPSSGNDFNIALSYIRRLSWPDTSATTVVNNESTFEISSDNYFDMGKKLIIRLNLDWKVLVTNRVLIDYSEQYRLGGYGSLRGYRQDQFSGRRVFLGQTELRLRPSTKSALYLFTDLGHVYSRKEVKSGIVESDNLTRIGAGFGFFVGSAGTQLKMEVGWGHNDRPEDGKVHFGLITLF